MKLSGKLFTALLLLFSLFAAAEKKAPMIQSGNQSCPISHPNAYSLLFETCNPNFNTEENYSTALTHLSYIYLAFSFVYFIFLAYWISISLKIRQRFRRIHFLMSGLILMKLLTLICATEDRYYEKITGSRILPDLLVFTHQIISSVRLFIVILLIFNVWPLLKPCLQVIDETVLCIMIPLRILSEIVTIMIGEYGYVKNRSEWNELVMLVNTMNPCFMMIANTVRTFGIGGARASARLEQVRTFYLIVTIYLTVIRALSNGEIKVKGVDAYEYLLKSNTAVEGFSLLFYVLIFRLFKKYFNGIE